MAEVISLEAKRGLIRDKTKYAWSENLERALAYAIAQSPSLWRSVGMHIDPNAALLDSTRIIMRVIQDHVRRFGSGPSSEASFCSHIETMYAHDQKVSVDERAEVLDAFVEAPEMAVEDVRAQGALHVKQRRRKHTLSVLEHQNAKGEDIRPQIDALLEIEDIGSTVADSIESIRLGDNFFEMIKKSRSAERISTGIPAVDERLQGGPARNTITTIGGASGAGKSWVLCQAACVNLIEGRRVYYVDSEMGAMAAYARIVGWLTGSSEQDVVAATPDVQRKWEVARQLIGPLVVEYVPPGTSIDRLSGFVDGAKRAPGFDGGVDLIISDYLDKWRGNGRELNKADAYGTVWETFRSVVVDECAWGITGSQVKDMGDRQVPSWEDLSWSRKKGEISDYVVTFWKTQEDAEERQFNVAKARRSPETEVTEPYVNQLDRCRVVPVNTDEWDALLAHHISISAQ